jgi:ABC-type Fe3+-siderophore transport system permease subunit
MSRYWNVLGASILISIAALLICPLIGPTPLDYSKIFTEGSLEAQIFWLARLPRVLLALLAGGALASAGVLFQALMRDALATPDTLGVSSGASLGAVVAICFGWADSARLGGLWTASLLGAGIVLMIVVGLSSSGRNVSSFPLLLANTLLARGEVEAGLFCIVAFDTFCRANELLKLVRGCYTTFSKHAGRVSPSRHESRAEPIGYYSTPAGSGSTLVFG